MMGLLWFWRIELKQPHRFKSTAPVKLSLGHLTGQEIWSGRRESNPRMQLGKLPFYH
jgi:hypothetical protein